MKLEKVKPPLAEYARVIPLGSGFLHADPGGLRRWDYGAYEGEVWLRYRHTERGELNATRMYVMAVNPAASKGVTVTYWREVKK